jgi:hypothetical protein
MIELDKVPKVQLQPAADLGIGDRPGGLEREVLCGHELQDVLPVGAGTGLLHDHLRQSTGRRLPRRVPGMHLLGAS